MELLTDHDYEKAAYTLSCRTNVIKAVGLVESNGSGFLLNGDLKILFEPHIFWKQLKDPVAALKAHPECFDVLYQRWKTYPYGKPSEQWDRLRKAAQIDLPAAYMSASYGKFQIMGFNYAAAGFSSVIEFEKRMEESEALHLYAFVNMVKSARLDKYLKKEDLTSFAKGWNGAGYRNGTESVLDDYDYKMIQALKKLDSGLLN